MSKPLNLCLLVLMAPLAASAQYQIKQVQVLALESYPNRVTVGPLTVAVDPYGTDERSFQVFDIKDLNSRGYHPLHVILLNRGNEYLSLRTRTVTLVTESGQGLFTTSAAILVEDVAKGGFSDKSSKNRGEDGGSPLADFSGKELTSRQIEPGRTVDGFLFFFSQDKGKNIFAGAKLRVPDVFYEGTRKPVGLIEVSTTPQPTSQPAP